MANIFEFQEQLVQDYASYVMSFIPIRDELINKYVQRELIDNKVLWPEPLIQMNPLFQPGASIDELVRQEALHPHCGQIFRREKSKDNPTGHPLRLHKHQEDAVRIARQGCSYVLTTGTGSGKSLAYIIPIVDYVLRHGSGKGVRAIIVYPMNALVNSQSTELEKFLCDGDPERQGPVTFKRYTGQENERERDAILENLPDILLTNYVMLELILTRKREKRLVDNSRLQFLVLDELHTYRGRQGADVALLMRRVKNYMGAPTLQYIGTSATLASEGNYEAQQDQVASAASKIFGTVIEPEHIINETLERTTRQQGPSEYFERQLKERITDPDKTPPQDYHDFLSDPLSIWIEDTYGLMEKDGRLLRVKPISLSHGAQLLSHRTGVPVEQCSKAIQESLLVGCSDRVDPDTGKAPFAFRLHQFISKGDTVYASLGTGPDRYLTLQRQQYVPEQPGKRDRLLFPLVFCRECGQEYYAVQKDGHRFLPKGSDSVADETDGDEKDIESGYLYVSADKPWPLDDNDVANEVPEDWTEERQEKLYVRRAQKPLLPKPVQIRPDGTLTESEEPDEQVVHCHFVQAPFRFCLYCGVSYSADQLKDFAKVATLSSEGRSTATTILSLSAIRKAKALASNNGHDGSHGQLSLAPKMLSFTDNRQDASLQAGHFNDFVEFGMLRSALYAAVRDAGERGLRHDELTQKVFDALELPFDYYAVEKDARYQAREEIQRAFRKVLGYRLYRDLQRGWRITSPNLEQCGLLTIDYLSLEQLCHDEDVWKECHGALRDAPPEVRVEISKTLLDHMRRELAIKVDYLNQSYQESLQQESNQRLIAPWSLDENESLVYATIMFPKSRKNEDRRYNIFISGRSGYGRYLRRQGLPRNYRSIGVEETEKIIRQLLERLHLAALVERVSEPRDKDDPGGYQLPASSIIWKVGDGMHAFHDPIRMPRAPRHGRQPNRFFVEFYRKPPRSLLDIYAREHTAQVPTKPRKEREDAFRAGNLPILYCSPTMELGIDIRDLNLVNMRNIPPTPANYVQRSGRAGRSGQPALVFSYCSIGSSHDQYFFKRPEAMVSGFVTPPRIDLANEDLIRAHVHALWLAETGISLQDSLQDILEVSGSKPSLRLRDEIRTGIESMQAKRSARQRAQALLDTLKFDPQEAKWYSENWLDEVLNQVVANFDRTCDRWRSLYRAAQSQFETQNHIILDASRSARDKQYAARLRDDAESQLSLLLNAEDAEHSDFYSYRYFATEGFLPGYNFPRLPLSAYIPARRGKYEAHDAYISRPRFLAISEFAPRAIVYHEGSRYEINQVILSVNEEGGGLVTRAAKQCGQCGYLHPLRDGDGIDVCEHCGAMLPQAMEKLFRLQNVSTKRRDRINSDEEERMRQGYQIRTAVRFTEKDGRLDRYDGKVVHETKKVLANLSYGSAAMLWRINFGWIRRKDQGAYGFQIDLERGYWEKDNQGARRDVKDSDDPMSPRIMRVIPFVDDRRNCLLFEPQVRLDTETMVSLQAALKRAMLVRYQLEDSELAVEPLPTTAKRHLLLFYEASEGGAGALRRLIDEPEELAQVARSALALCHYDPQTGEDLHHAHGVQENCEAACYHCLMTYTNQRDHLLLDRKRIFAILRELTHTRIKMHVVEAPQVEELSQAIEQSSADMLEQDWLQMLSEGGYRLPSGAHATIGNVVPDFLYEDQGAAIFVDGSPDEYPGRHTREADTVEDYGYMVIRFGARQTWTTLLDRYPDIFGRKA